MITLIILAFIVVVACIFIFGNTTLSIALILLWLAFAIVMGVIYYLRWRGYEETGIAKLDELLEAANRSKRKNFKLAADRIVKQYKSIEARRDYINSMSDANIQGVYEKILEQAESNVITATSYINQYDYYTNPSTKYLDDLCQHGDTLVFKFNALVEQLIDIDTNPTQLDMAYVDDVINCMEEIKKL
ncbi:MAG: hypothetical protein IKQ71_03530 [Lachnospiraceae bacterium]|nr:hypothetical protein [Lachnospiraceae bacterium]